MGTLIKNGLVVGSGGSRIADVRVEGERITEVGEGLDADGFEVVDASGCLVFPGFIDPRVRFDMFNGTTTTADDFRSGTAAAVAGGSSSVFDCAVQRRGSSLREALSLARERAGAECSCDYGFHMLVSDFDRAEKDIPWCMDNGVTSFVAYMSGDNRIDDEQLKKLLVAVSSCGGLLSVHCEDGERIDALTHEAKKHGQTLLPFYTKTRPDDVEAEAVSRVLAIAAQVKAPVNLMTLSAKKSVVLVRRARRTGQKVYFETAPQYLILNEGEYSRLSFGAAKFVCSPPLRTAADIKTLWEAANRSEIDVIASDHCAYNFAAQKALSPTDFTKIPSGLPGVEQRPLLVYNFGMLDAVITENQLVRMLCENPAGLYGLSEFKGELRVGLDADIVVMDRFSRGVISQRTQHTTVDYTPYENTWIQGAVREVFLRGERAVEDGKLTGRARGRFIRAGKPRFYR